MIRLIAALISIAICLQPVAASPAMIMGQLAAYGSCKLLDSTWGPQWASIKALYHFEDALNSANAVDSSGTSNTGISRNVNFQTASKMGNSGNFYFSNHLNTTNQFSPPQTFSLSGWFKTSSTSGGVIMGYADSQMNIDPTNYDRHVYMSNDGKLNFGVYDGALRIVTSASAYNNGAWHHFAATFSANDQKLYVDGAQVASSTAANFAQGHSGYWRIGNMKMDGWSTNQEHWDGELDDIAFFDAVLTSTDVSTIYGSATQLQSGSPKWSNVKSLWRFEETSGSTIADSSGQGNTANLVGSLKSTTGKYGNALTFQGQAMLGTTTSQTSPSSFTVAMWFKTTSTYGGGLFQFNEYQMTNASNHDRHVNIDDDGTLYFGVWSGSTDFIQTTESFNDGKWHHMAAVLSGGTAMSLYVDGKLRASRTTNLVNFNGYWRIGYADLSGWPGNFGINSFDGSIDEAAIWHSALTAAEIREIYDRQSCGKN